MPFVVSRTNTPITKEQELSLKTGFGTAIALVPGKSEEYLLLTFEPDCHMYLRGSGDEPIAYIEASIFGNEGHYGYEEFTAEVTRLYGDILGIKPENVYIKFSDITGWGAAGTYIDRWRFR